MRIKKALINMCHYFIDKFFHHLVEENRNRINYLLFLKSNINNKINDFIIYNLNIKSVLNFIELKLNNAEQ